MHFITLKTELMPKIQKIFTLEVTPAAFLKALDDQELIELDMLIQQPKYQKRIVKLLSQPDE
tara:strand:+ start:458 stop:643 length:186 start_codon:yes stop_codon:yes gene_type:complete